VDFAPGGSGPPNPSKRGAVLGELRPRPDRRRGWAAMRASDHCARAQRGLPALPQGQGLDGVSENARRHRPARVTEIRVKVHTGPPDRARAPKQTFLPHSSGAIGRTRRHRHRLQGWPHKQGGDGRQNRSWQHASKARGGWVVAAVPRAPLGGLTLRVAMGKEWATKVLWAPWGGGLIHRLSPDILEPQWGRNGLRRCCGPLEEG
jgi:hypothetical protein